VLRSVTVGFIDLGYGGLPDLRCVELNLGELPGYR